MARLLDQFSTVFLFGLRIDAANTDAANTAGATEKPDSPASLPASRAAAQEEARRLLAAARSAAAAVGTPSAQVESAAFATVAWLDEIFARQRRWADSAPPLQAQLFNSSNAHSEFFHHLSGLQADEDAVREVYWYALVNGFTGQYYFEGDDGGELGKLKDLHGRQLPVAPVSIATLAKEHITPQPYAQLRTMPPRDPERRERALLRAVVSGAVFVPLVALLWLMLAGPSQTAASAEQRLDQQLRSYACADLQATWGVTGAAGAFSALHISGFVPLAEDSARIERDVRALPGMSSATFDLRLRVWPHCEVVAILKPYQTRNREKTFDLKVTAPSAHDGQLREGDPVRIEITAPHYEGNVRVDYYTADGSVQHLSGAGEPARFVAGQRLVFGKDIPSSWLVSPPFGSVMVAALASPSPFPEAPDRPPFELASAYLLRLREALAANKGGDRLIAEFLFLETAER